MIQLMYANTPVMISPSRERKTPKTLEEASMPKGIYIRQRRPVEELFWPKVDRNGPFPLHCPELGVCWIWTACRRSSGYGKFGYFGRTESAHVVAFILTYGERPADKPWVLHACDGGAIGCVRPSHLFSGTNADNRKDMYAKGRQAQGEQHGSKVNPERTPRGSCHWNAKLTSSQVAEIRTRTESSSSIAAEYGVAARQIRRIRQGLRWADKGPVKPAPGPRIRFSGSRA